MKTDRGFYLFFLALLVVFAVHAAYLACPAEDAFIAFRFAKNLAHGHGLTWNAGEPPVEGYTNFLWVLLCSLAIDLELDPRVCAQILGIIAGMAALFYAYLYSKDLLGAGAVRSLLPCLMLALSGPFAAWTSGGMETGLFTLLVLMSCYYFASFWKRRAAFSMYIASASVFLATLTRPEGFMVWAALALLCFVLRDARTRSRDLAGPAVLYLFPLLIYVSWRYRYFGFLLPNTYYAKTDWTVYQALRGGLYAAFFGLYFILPLLPPIVYAHRKRERPAPGWNAVRARLREHPGTPTCFWICLVYTLYIILIGGDYMAMFRFFAPLMPLIYILFGASTGMPHSPASTSLRSRRAAAGLIALSAGLTLLHSTPLETRMLPKPPRQHGTYRGIETERWHVARLSMLGVFFDSYKRSPNESLATSAIGAISYHADMKVYDFFGLVDTHIAHLPAAAGGAPGLPGHEKEDFRFLFSKKPTYIIFTRLLAREPPPFPDYRAFSPASTPGDGRARGSDETERWMSAFLREHYDLKCVRLADRENNEEGYFAFLELKRQRRQPGVGAEPRSGPGE